jgi:hypothetical protein
VIESFEPLHFSKDFMFGYVRLWQISFKYYLVSILNRSDLGSAKGIADRRSLV